MTDAQKRVLKYLSRQYPGWVLAEDFDHSLCCEADDLVLLPALVEDGLVSYQSHGMYRITPAGGEKLILEGGI